MYTNEFVYTFSERTAKSAREERAAKSAPSRARREERAEKSAPPRARREERAAKSAPRRARREERAAKSGKNSQETYLVYTVTRK